LTNQQAHSALLRLNHVEFAKTSFFREKNMSSHYTAPDMFLTPRKKKEKNRSRDDQKQISVTKVSFEKYIIQIFEQIFMIFLN